MIKIKKTFRLDSALDVNPALYGYANFTELANDAISELLKNAATPADAAADIISFISTQITNLEAKRDYAQSPDAFSIDQAEFLAAINLVYDILIRTDIIKKNPKLQVYVDDPLLLEQNEEPYTRHREAYSEIDFEFLNKLLKK